MPRATTIPRLWLLTDPRLGDDWSQLLDALPVGTGVIMRADQAVDAKALARKCRARRLPLFVAGDARLAQRLRAEGLWWRATEMRPRRHDPHWHHIGAAHDQRELVAAMRAGVAAVLLSPVFPTRSHPGAAGLGACRFGLLLRHARLPVIALGGITARSVRRLNGLDIFGLAAIDGWQEGALKYRRRYASRQLPQGG